MSIENLMTGADTYVPLAEVTGADSVETPDATPTLSLFIGTVNTGIIFTFVQSC